MWNKNICLTSRKSIMVLVILLVSSLVLASVWSSEVVEEIKETPPVNNEETQMWIPTEEDIAYQDSMYSIIKNTQNDITDIKEDIVFILEILDYGDGTYDSN